MNKGGTTVHLSKPIECTTPRVNPKVNYRFGVIMTYQGAFISCKQCTSLRTYMYTFPQSFTSFFVHSFNQTSTKWLFCDRCGSPGKVLENPKLRYFLSSRMSPLINYHRRNRSHQLVVKVLLLGN